ncbi:hypothetical protein Prudu_1499S000600 [Prunus dulcis]|uniref:Leucine-rich repeat-containing N-terminal plant-type domain-containing protein n=1 Tax=Prunus dulcis TaxID=3755 RepID=A0A5H2Y5X8_PRUDU|nr:hypothetical protein Prudu_1499S000600 [Prunus dulcis]
MDWLSWLCLLFLLSTTCQLNCTCSSSSNSSSSLSSRHLCHPHDSSALLQFKNSFSIDTSSELEFYTGITFHSNWTISWQKGKDCCAWSGITCEKMTDHVIGLNLDSNSSLFSLGHLKRLDLSGNDFRGSPIFSQFGGFVSVTHLDLSHSNFSGPIPFEISHLSNLVSLNLSEADVTIDTLSLNRIVHNLTNLNKELQLSGVDMSSVVPDSFKNFSSSLTTLKLSWCNLQGIFPESIFNQPNLRLIDLSDNFNLTGSLPNSN